MMFNSRNFMLFAFMAIALIAVGAMQSWTVSLSILNLCLISAIMALGVNTQWGYAGLLNVGAMGFAALGGAAVIFVSAAPVAEAWTVGGPGLLLTLLVPAGAAVGIIAVNKATRRKSKARVVGTIVVLAIAYLVARQIFVPAIAAIEAVNPSASGYLGGAGLPVILSWLVAPILAAGVAWFIGKVALGLRSDYLAIATLGISAIIVTIAKNEDWLTRGVKNVVGLPRPVPYEADLQQAEWVQRWAANLDMSVIDLASILVKLGYAALFGVVLIALMWLSEKALNSPWGRMMRAVRDNEDAASAMGKDVKAAHLKVFILGSGILGLAGALLVTLDGQFTPGSYVPIRYTFLIWVMVIVGGSGNNWGSVLGGFLIWFCWIEAEPFGRWFLDVSTSMLGEDNAVRRNLIENASQMRHIVMGLILLITLRFMPQGLMPERKTLGKS